MATVRVGVARYLWSVPADGALTHPQWPDSLYQQMFNGGSGWSLHDFWLRSTFGFIDVNFEIRPWRILRRTQAELKDSRNDILAAVRTQAREDGEPLDGYDRVIAFMHAPECNAGAQGTPGDAVFDQNAWLPYYQHEIGHVLGFEHSFGPGGPYDDPYCVMGATDMETPAAAPPGQLTAHDFPVPPDFSGVAFTQRGFFRSDRVLCAAALYRYLPDFAASDRLVYVDLAKGSRVSLTALTHGHWGGTVLAVVHTDIGGFTTYFTVEYRARFGDDEGMRPAVVVHSIGRRSWDSGHEVNPVWYEAAIDPVTGTTQVVDHDLQLEITDSSDREVGVYITQAT